MSNKRKEHALQTREKLLRCAVKLVTQKSFDELSVEDITSACGVAKGTFYTYFKRKEDVIFEICREPFSNIQKKLSGMKGRSIEEKLTCYFRFFMQEVERYGVNICREWIRGVIDPATAPKNMDSQKWQYDTNMLREILQDAIQNGELKANTPVDLLVHLIISQMYGMMTCWCMSDTQFEPKEWVKPFCEIELKHILKEFICKEKKK